MYNEDMKDFDEYQRLIEKYDTMNAPGEHRVHEPCFMEKILGLSGEAGEVTEKFKKVIRDRDGELTEKDKKEIAKELGDVLWYTATVARYMGVSFKEVAETNLEKAEGRMRRGKLHGSGDDR